MRTNTPEKNSAEKFVISDSEPIGFELYIGEVITQEKINEARS